MLLKPRVTTISPATGFADRNKDKVDVDLPRDRHPPRNFWRAAAAARDVSLRERKIMRFRSIATLCIFAAAAIVALKYPLAGLGTCCCCLIVYLKPEAPGAEG